MRACILHLFKLALFTLFFILQIPMMCHFNALPIARLYDTRLMTC
jgi:hypothetical protein